MGSCIRKLGSVHCAALAIRSGGTRVRIARLTRGCAEKFAIELRAKMLLGRALAVGENSSAVALSKLMQKSSRVFSSNNDLRAVERERLAHRTFVEKTGNEVSARTVNIELGGVKAMLNRAVQPDLIPKSPVASARQVKRPLLQAD